MGRKLIFLECSLGPQVWEGRHLEVSKGVSYLCKVGRGLRPSLAPAWGFKAEAHSTELLLSLVEADMILEPAQVRDAHLLLTL